MKSMIRNLLALAFGAAVGTSALAAPITLPNGPIFIQFSNLEQVGAVNPGYAPLLLGYDNSGAAVTVSGSEFNWGVFNVSSIQRGGVADPHVNISGGAAFMVDDGPGGGLFNQGQVFGIFYGVKATAEPLHATGGFLDLYWQDAGSDTISLDDLSGTTYTPAARTNWNQAGEFTAGTLLARFQYASGAVPGDNTTTVSSTLDPTNFTGTGQADTYANVLDINGDGLFTAADGAWASQLNTDWFFVDPNGNGIRGEAGETRDLRFTTFFEDLSAIPNAWDRAGVQGLRSNDPARAFAVPEPASLALFGIGLLGAGLVRRRRTAA